MAVYAVINEYDRCIRCRGCQVSCQRNFVNNSLLGYSLPAYQTGDRVSFEDPKVVKSQAYVDMHPFLNYNCWHCPDPPCQAACPFNAIAKLQTGEVRIDFESCSPANCKDSRGRYPCNYACIRGGFPKIPPLALANSLGIQYKAYKCDMCYGRRRPLTINGEYKDLMVDKCTFESFNTDVKSGSIPVSDRVVPACVLSCPTGALKFGYLNDVKNYFTTKQNSPIDGYQYLKGNGSWYWMGKYMAAEPTADPLAEDHLLTFSQGLLSSPAAKSLVLPAAITLGLYAIYKRRVELGKES